MSRVVTQTKPVTVEIEPVRRALSAAMFESACAYPASWHPGLSGPERIIQRKG